jgi:1-acyl-sn-glycerol-3-phosphate acyltransferase
MQRLIFKGDRLGQVAIGCFLAVHYACLLPFAEEVYGRHGTIPDARLNPVLLPGAALVDAFPSPALLVLALAVLAALLALGIATRFAAGVLWLGAAALFHRNVLTVNPALPFLGLWLLAHSLTGNTRDPTVSRLLWWITGAAYGYSAVTKLLSPSWASGAAVPLILASPLGRFHALAALPPALGTAATYATLLLEGSYVPLAFIRRARPWLLLATIGLHAGLVATVDIADISVGMLAFHATLIDPAWFRRPVTVLGRNKAALFPGFLMRSLVRRLVRTMYRVQESGLENLPDAGPAVLVCNHVSFVDALVISAAVRRPIRFVMDHRIWRTPVLSFLFRSARAIPIAPARENAALMEKAFDDVAEALEAGELVCIFPEGKITSTGDMNPFRPGIERIVQRSPVPVVPLALRGLWGSFFSRKGGPAMRRPLRRFRSKIGLVAAPAVPPGRATAVGLEALVANLRGAG